MFAPAHCDQWFVSCSVVIYPHYSNHSLQTSSVKVSETIGTMPDWLTIDCYDLFPNWNSRSTIGAFRRKEISNAVTTVYHSLLKTFPNSFPTSFKLKDLKKMDLTKSKISELQFEDNDWNVFVRLKWSRWWEESFSQWILMKQR